MSYKVYKLEQQETPSPLHKSLEKPVQWKLTNQWNENQMLLELSGEGKVPFGNFLIRFSSVGRADG